MPLPIEDVVIYPLELGGDPKEKIVELKIQFIKQLNFSDLLNYTQLKNYTPDFWKPLNILMRWLRLWDPKL